jgi:hypothetical protein
MDPRRETRADQHQAAERGYRRSAQPEQQGDHGRMPAPGDHRVAADERRGEEDPGDAELATDGGGG